MHSHCTVQTTCVAWLKGLEGSRRIVCQKHSLIHASCFTWGLTVHRTPAQVVLLSSSSPNPDLLSTHPLIHCEDPRRDGISTEFHSPQVRSPRGSSSPGFWSIHKIKQLMTRMMLRNLVSNRCHIMDTLSLRFDGKQALRRRPTRSSKTNSYARYWLHHCIFRNERKMKDKHALLTLNEKA